MKNENLIKIGVGSVLLAGLTIGTVKIVKWVKRKRNQGSKEVVTEKETVK